jgi:hypothetical protein
MDGFGPLYNASTPAKQASYPTDLVAIATSSGGAYLGGTNIGQTS